MIYLRNIFTLCMALLVTIPLCVCGNTALFDLEVKEATCHSHCHNTSNDDHEEAPHCDSSDHDELQFLLPNDEASFSHLDKLESNFSQQESTPSWTTFNFERTTRPPPDIGCFLSARRLHKTYSSYRL